MVSVVYNADFRPPPISGAEQGPPPLQTGCCGTECWRGRELRRSERAADSRRCVWQGQVGPWGHLCGAPETLALHGDDPSCPVGTWGALVAVAEGLP